MHSGCDAMFGDDVPLRVVDVAVNLVAIVIKYGNGTNVTVRHVMICMTVA